MFNVGGGEMLIILLVALLVLGPTKLPEAARQVGQVMREIKRVSTGFQDELRNAMNTDDEDDAVEAAARERGKAVVAEDKARRDAEQRARAAEANAAAAKAARSAEAAREAPVKPAGVGPEDLTAAAALGPGTALAPGVIADEPDLDDDLDDADDDFDDDDEDLHDTAAADEAGDTAGADRDDTAGADEARR